MAGGQSSPFPIDFAGRPYNSATLPCALWFRDLIYIIGLIEFLSDPVIVCHVYGMFVERKTYHICIETQKRKKRRHSNNI